MQLHRLTILDLGQNHLRELPENLGTMLPHLRRFHVEENRLFYVPASLRLCDTLNYFNVCENEFIPWEKIDQRCFWNTSHLIWTYQQDVTLNYVPSLQHIASLALLEEEGKDLPEDVSHFIHKRIEKCTYCRHYQIHDRIPCLVYQPAPWKQDLKVYATGQSHYRSTSSTLPFLYTLCQKCASHLATLYHVVHLDLVIKNYFHRDISPSS
jgi:Leucine-rich repeat (LRR) protein